MTLRQKSLIDIDTSHVHFKIASNMATKIQQNYPKIWTKGKRLAKQRLIKYILRELKDYKQAKWESEPYEAIYEGACEMYVESWQNRY